MGRFFPLDKNRYAACLLACGAALLTSFFSGAAYGQGAGSCPGNPNALGVSRVVEVDTTGGPGFGLEHFKQHDFLRQGEVVLTFDDGPWPKNTPAVLAALAAHCTKAIFFPIGLHATWEPAILKHVAEAGHAIGSHTWCHADLSKTTGKCREGGKTVDYTYTGIGEIEKGISAVRWAVGGPTAPYFRFPALKQPPELINYLGKRNIATFSTDLDSFDFKMRKPEEVRQSVMEKLKKSGKGIVLMHDFQNATGAAAMDLLNDLKAGGYKIVFMRPKYPVTTLASYDEALLKEIGPPPGAVATAPVTPSPSAPPPTKPVPVPPVAATPAPAAAPSPTVATAPIPTAPTLQNGARADRRVALVVGNAAYKSVPVLATPRNDAQAVAATLRAVGFQVVRLEADLGRQGFLDALQSFAREADQADWAVVYFAGHGIEIPARRGMSGANYLIPVDARLESERDVEYQDVPLDQVLSAVERARRFRLVILDACRDNPFANQISRISGTRSLGRGLARVEPDAGLQVLYAAKHGEIALDGSGGNSPFVTALTKRLPTPGLEVGKLFRLVGDDVLQATGGRQEPMVYGRLPGEDFFFVPAN
jgi:peptidoglycan/xylan/chitin deacetylase (PgdA/CDA1 family)